MTPGNKRCVALASTLAGAIAIASLSSMPVAGQSSQRAARPSAAGAPRTPWGEPDLQGIWSGQTLTPLQRPARFANKPILTEQEAARLAEEVSARPGRDQRAERGTEQDVAGAYNAVWSNRPTRFLDRRTSLIVEPADGKIPPLTPDAKKREQARRDYLEALLQGTSGGRPGPTSPRRADAPPRYNIDRMNRADGPEDRSTSERCMGGQLPNFGAFYRIVQSPGFVSIYHDTGQGQGFSRVIPTDGSPHLPPQFRRWLGDARGHWEGNTLVVDITNFTDKTDYQGSRENLHLVERFTRADNDTLNYEVRIEDPTTWTRSWTVAVPWRKEDDQQNRVFESTCHEGNYGLIGMLTNTRAAENAFKEGKGPDPAKQDIATGGDEGGGIEREP